MHSRADDTWWPRSVWKSLERTLWPSNSPFLHISDAYWHLRVEDVRQVLTVELFKLLSDPAGHLWVQTLELL